MTKKELIRISKFLSLVLRHQPETINIDPDEQGWVKTSELIQKANQNGMHLTPENLAYVVENNDKNRFTFSPNREKIRASQGHSIDIDLRLEEKIPPEILYHGTAAHHLGSIMKKGLLKGKRQYVHLPDNTETACQVGIRYGKPFVLKIRAKNMHDMGNRFYRSENGVWLVDYVPVAFIDREEPERI